MKKILIIDSDIDFLNSLSDSLRTSGYEPIGASYAAAGLEKAPDASLIIVCVELPDQNGFVVCSQLKRSPQTAHIPVFITSSATSTEAFEQHLNLANHADGYFLKPLDIQAMLQEMDAIFADLNAMQNGQVPNNASNDEMIDVSNPAEENSSDDDSEVIKALTVGDMSLFGDIDSKDLEASDLGFDVMDNANAPKVQQKPATPVPPLPIASRMPSRTGTGPRPLSSASIKPVADNLAPRATVTGMPQASSSTNLPRAQVSQSLVGGRIQVNPVEKKPLSASFSSVSQTAIPAADLARLTDEITVLNNEITALKSEITARDNRITMLQSQCDALTSRCQNAEAITEALKSETEQAIIQKDEAIQQKELALKQISELEMSTQNILSQVQSLATQLLSLTPSK